MQRRDEVICGLKTTRIHVGHVRMVLTNQDTKLIQQLEQFRCAFYGLIECAQERLLLRVSQSGSSSNARALDLQALNEFGKGRLSAIELLIVYVIRINRCVGLPFRHQLQHPVTHLQIKTDLALAIRECVESRIYRPQQIEGPRLGGVLNMPRPPQPVRPGPPSTVRGERAPTAGSGARGPGADLADRTPRAWRRGDRELPGRTPRRDRS